jgi:ribosomal protein L32
MKAVADLKPEIKKLFLKQIIDLFGTYEEFWISNTTNGFKLQHNIDDTLTIIRLRECINCGVEQFSDPILTKKDVDKELTKPITVLCSTCEHFVLPMFIYDA